MSHSNELVLLYSTASLPDAGKLGAVFAVMGIRTRVVAPAQTGETVGHLAGLAGFPPAESRAPAPLIPVPMMVLCGLTSARLDALLLALRRAEAPRIPHKAVLTQSNAPWPLFALYEELTREREALAPTPRPAGGG